jgi:hypothetical protein
VNIRKLIVVTAIASGHLSGQVYVGETRTGGIGVTRLTETEPPHGTVAVGIAISEGIVLAADSRMTTNTRVISDSASKLFDIGRIGIVTYGQAFLEGRNIAAWVADFRTDHRNGNVEEISRRFADFIALPYNRQFPQAAPRPILAVRG